MTTSVTGKLLGECADFSAEIRPTSAGVCVVTVHRKTRGEGGNTPAAKTERSSGHDRWEEGIAKQKQQSDTYSFTVGSEAQARKMLQDRTRHQIKWTGADAHVHVGDVAKFKDKGLSVEDARKHMVEAGEAPRGLASEKAKNDATGAAPPKPAQQPAGIVLTHEEKVELANKRAMAFMNQHPEFVSSGFNWERMLRCAMDHGFIPDAKSPATVEQWEFCFNYLLERSMIIQVEGQTTPVRPYQFVKDEPAPTPSGAKQKQGLDAARRELRNVSTAELEAREKQRQAQRKAEKAGVQPATKPAPEVSVADAKQMSLEDLQRLERQRQAQVVTRQRGTI